MINAWHTQQEEEKVYYTVKVSCSNCEYGHGLHDSTTAIEKGELVPKIMTCPRCGNRTLSKA